jgi:hypothetical protein
VSKTPAPQKAGLIYLRHAIRLPLLTCGTSHEIYTGPKNKIRRFFKIEGDKLTIWTPEIVSAVRVGKKLAAL